jgi:hypothetical protein
MVLNWTKAIVGFSEAKINNNYLAKQILPIFFSHAKSNLVIIPSSSIS